MSYFNKVIQPCLLEVPRMGKVREVVSTKLQEIRDQVADHQSESAGVAMGSAILEWIHQAGNHTKVAMDRFRKDMDRVATLLENALPRTLDVTVEECRASKAWKVSADDSESADGGKNEADPESKEGNDSDGTDRGTQSPAKKQKTEASEPPKASSTGNIAPGGEKRYNTRLTARGQTPPAGDDKEKQKQGNDKRSPNRGGGSA
jgi:hypothetical protein